MERHAQHPKHSTSARAHKKKKQDSVETALEAMDAEKMETEKKRKQKKRNDEESTEEALVAMDT